MIVDCAVYAEGLRLPGTWDPVGALEEARRRQGAYAWVGLREPGSGELDGIAAAYGLHELAVEDAVHAHQRPKLERHDGVLAVTLKPAAYVDAIEMVEIGELMVMVADDFVVTVRHGSVGDLEQVRARLDRDRSLAAAGPGAVLYAVADRVVDDYADVLAGLDEDVDDVETRVFTPGNGDLSQRIYLLKREVLQFRRAVHPLASPLERLARGEVAGVAPETKPWFGDVHDHLLRVAEQVEVYDRQLADVLAANLSQVQVQQNLDQRKISAWAAIALVPTVVGAIYGMNFEHMPELGWQWGYPAALSATAVTCASLWRGFRRNGWL